MKYDVGDIVRYRTFSGKKRRVFVEAKLRDVKNGMPGFEGMDIATGISVWGYDSQVMYVEDCPAEQLRRVVS